MLSIYEKKFLFNKFAQRKKNYVCMWMYYVYCCIVVS